MPKNATPEIGAPPGDPRIVKHYHAHIYYDPALTRDRAALLRERVAAAFPAATLGRWHDAPVGPHPQSMYQIAFPSELLATLLPWLMLNRDGLKAGPMFAEDCPFKVIRTNGSDEVLARASNLLIGRAAFETAKRLYPRNVTGPSPEAPSFPANADGAAAASPRRHVLPKDLPGAIKQLDDQELDRLLAAALAEQERRGRKSPVSIETSCKPRIEGAAVHLTPGKLNAVRAAFKAGVKPSQIARQFGLSQSDVRKALASDASKAKGTAPRSKLNPVAGD